MTGSRSTIRRVARWATDIALFAVIVTVVAVLGLARVPPLVGARTLIVGGGSMAPTIPLGSIVVVTPVSPSAIAVGDVVSVRLDDARSIYTHRVTRLTTHDGAPYIETRGDANAAPDPVIVPVRSVIGRVAWSMPYAGFLVAAMTDPVGIVGVLSLIATLLAVMWLLQPEDEAAAVPDAVPTPARGPRTGRRAPVRG